jgi:macrolide transport system ATP-binding/permease protein
MNVIELRDINKIYQMGKVEVLALDGVSLDVATGDFVAIMGASGSGKSTLLHVLGLLDRPTSGTYHLMGRETARLTDGELATLRNKNLGFIFQSFNLLPKLTSLKNVGLPKIYNVGGTSNDETAMLSLVGLEDRASHRPNELSGGQQQRVAIARALVNRPRIIMADEPTGNLDTKSAQEIIGLLTKLNESGITIVMVTHESNLAQSTRRIIRLQDGKVISDERLKAIPQAMVNGGALSGDSLGHKVVTGSRVREYFQQAIDSLTMNKTRAALSILGVMIGVSSLIAMLALGNGAQADVKKRLSSLGTNVLSVRPSSASRGGVSMGSGSSIKLTLDDSREVAGIPGVDKVAPYVNGNVQAVYGSSNWSTSVSGTSAAYAEVKSSQPSRGRFFTDEETVMRKKVAVIGKTVATKLFGNNDPLGEYIKINRIDFHVIGILPEKGATGFRDQDDQIVIPVNTAMYRLFGTEYLNSIDVYVNDASKMDDVSDRIKQAILLKHRLPSSKNEIINVRNMADIQETLTSTMKTFTYLLGSVALISLLVGGIGIMNIMLVSVTERTNEIGLRKAIGADNDDIMFQFLIESVFICLLGGGIGVLIGLGVSIVMGKFAGWSMSVTADSIVLALSFSLIIGVVFGLWPARKASNLSPIDALRYS